MDVHQFDIIIRGGLAYVLHSKDFSYPLKDIDLAINKVHRDVVINYFNKRLCWVFKSERIWDGSDYAILDGRHIF